MKRIEEKPEHDLVDLGRATAETKGPPVAGKDTHGGIDLMGLSND